MSNFKNIILIVALFLAGCGFHLRGALPLPAVLKNVYIETKEPYGQYVRHLRLFLKLSNVNVVNTPDKATAIMKMIDEATSARMLTYMVSQHVTVHQYQLILTVTFAIADKFGKLLITPQTVTQSRTLTLNESRMLAGSNEAQFLYEQMRQAIVYDILNRLSAKDLLQNIK